jgi:hypothetical protein
MNPRRAPGTVDIGAAGHAYFDTVQTQIRERLTYPCVPRGAAGGCESCGARRRFPPCPTT